jgi:fructose-bisphosphate aldolase class 1
MERRSRRARLSVSQVPDCLAVANFSRAGIKLDGGYKNSYIPGTKVGPLGHPETMDKGLDALREKAQKAYAAGARFAKWRNVLQIDPDQGLPSELSIQEATTQLAKYAAICQSEGLVSLVAAKQPFMYGSLFLSHPSLFCLSFVCALPPLPL